jgi:hypothetical protein
MLGQEDVRDVKVASTLAVALSFVLETLASCSQECALQSKASGRLAYIAASI